MLWQCTSIEYVRIIHIGTICIQYRLSVDTLDTVTINLTPVTTFLVHHVRSSSSPHTFNGNTSIIFTIIYDCNNFIFSQDTPSSINFPLQVLTPNWATHKLNVISTLSDQTGICTKTSKSTSTINRNRSWEILIITCPISN